MIPYGPISVRSMQTFRPPDRGAAARVIIIIHRSLVLGVGHGEFIARSIVGPGRRGGVAQTSLWMSGLQSNRR